MNRDDYEAEVMAAAEAFLQREYGYSKAIREAVDSFCDLWEFMFNRPKKSSLEPVRVVDRPEYREFERLMSMPESSAILLSKGMKVEKVYGLWRFESA